MSAHHFEVALTGGGMVGASLAAELSADARVLLYCQNLSQQSVSGGPGLTRPSFQGAEALRA